jgi:hypothetical protein
MADTWRVRTLRTQHADSTLFGSDGLFGIVNNSANSVIGIRSISIQSPSGLTGVDTPTTVLNSGIGRYRLFRISGMSGGGDIVSSVKFDLDDANLPAEVVCRSKPDTVTESGELRFVGDLPGISTAMAALNGGWSSHIPATRRVNTSDIFNANAATGTTKIVLREGEGVAIIEAETQSVSHLQMGAIAIRNVSTGALYTYFQPEMNTRESGANPALAVFNGVGSGVVLEVVHVNLFDLGMADILNTLYSLCRICKLNRFDTATDGVALTPIPHDTDNASLPSGIDIRKNFKMYPQTVNQEQYNTLNLFDISANAQQTVSTPVTVARVTESYRSGFLRSFFRDPFADVIPVRCELSVGRTVLVYGGGSTGNQVLKLRPKQGLGVGYGWSPDPLGLNNHMSYTTHTYNNMDISCEFTVEDGPPPSGGAIVNQGLHAIESGVMA